MSAGVAGGRQGGSTGLDAGGQLSVSEHPAVVGHGRGFGGTLDLTEEKTEEGVVFVVFHPFAFRERQEALLLVVADDGDVGERHIRVRHHIADRPPHGIGQGLQRRGGVESFARLHSHLIVIVSEIDHATEVAARHGWHQLTALHRTTIERDHLLHAGLKTEGHIGRHPHVAAEMGEGIDGIAHRAVEFAAHGADIIHDRHTAGVGDDGGRPDEHAIGIGIPTATPPVVDDRKGDATMTAPAGKHQSEGSHQQQVGREPVRCAPSIDGATVEAGRTADGGSPRIRHLGRQTGEGHTGKTRPLVIGRPAILIALTSLLLLHRRLIK